MASSRKDDLVCLEYILKRGLGWRHWLMGYEVSLGMAWEELEKLGLPPKCSLSLLRDRYEIRLAERKVLLQPYGLEADETVAVLILRYLIGRLKKGYTPLGEWISIKETTGGKLFCSSFTRRAIRPLLEQFSQEPEGLVRILRDKYGGRMVGDADIAIEVQTFPGIIVRVLFWKSDEDLPAEATMLFDRALTEIFIMEDLTVLLTILADDILSIAEKQGSK